ncbi:MAG: purine permease [Clostridiales bacterium]|nr:purine permease [Clostridiales bacterium]
MEQTKKNKASIFEWNGLPEFGKALPLALQHVVAMIVGCVTPAIIVAGVANLDTSDRVLLIQASLIVSAITTLIQLFPIGKKKGFHLGAGLPVIMGVSFAYVASMQAIAADFGMAAIFGAQIIGGIVALLIGFVIDKIRVVFPPLVTGTVVFTIGISLYPTAVNYMAGGSSSADYGSWQNWLVAFITLAVVVLLNHFSKGFLKLASILMGIVVGYIVAACFGMVDLSAVATSSFFQAPRVVHFGLQFEPSACVTIALLFAINSIQAIGDFTATTSGSMDREPSNQELKGGIVAYGVMNIIGALLGCPPTATYSQNVGIVTTTKVINRFVLGLAALILLVAGLVPKFSGLLTTIPQCVLGGATISVFASIAMTGIKLFSSQGLTFRNTSIVGLAVALGVGVTQASASLAMFPAWVTTVFGKTPVVVATIVAILLNLILPKDKPAEETPKAEESKAE